MLEEKAKAVAAEKEEAKMLKLSERIRHDLPLTESEWAGGTVGKPLRPLLGGRGKRGRKRNFLEVAALIVDNGSGKFLAGFLVSTLLTLCSLRPSACLSFQASWPVCTRRTVAHSSSTLAVAYPRLVLLVFHLALCFLSIVVWPQMLGIMAVMDQKEFLAF